jgi:hypothetical protein
MNEDRKAEIIEEFPALAGVDPGQDSSQTVIIPPVAETKRETPEPDLQPMPPEPMEDTEPVPAMAASDPQGNEDMPTKPPLEIDQGFDPDWTPEERVSERSLTGGGTGGGLQVSGEESVTAPPPPFTPVSGEDQAEKVSASCDEPDDAYMDEHEVEFPVEPEYTEEPERIPLEEIHGEVEDVPVLLTEVADDDISLFEDSSLDIVRMESGESRAIEIPVEVRNGEQTRRYKLSVTLSLDKVE